MKKRQILNKYKKILVTGGAGFIGSHLVEELLALGKKVVVFDNISTGTKRNIPKRVKFIKGDLRQQKEISQATRGVDLVFHLAANINGSISVNDPAFDFQVNASGTLNTLKASLDAKIKKFIYISSAGVYGKPLYSPIDEKHTTEFYLPYGGSKYIGEVYCYVFYRTYNLPMVIARPFCVYGKRENPRFSLVEVSRYLRWHLNKKPIQIVGDPNKKIRDFVHVSDVVKGLILLADKGKAGEPYNIGSGEETSMKKLVEIIGQAMGQKPKIKIINLKEDTYSLVADISKIKSIGYRPKIFIKEGVRQLVKELGKNPKFPSGNTIFKIGQKSETNL